MIDRLDPHARERASSTYLNFTDATRGLDNATPGLAKQTDVFIGHGAKQLDQRIAKALYSRGGVYKCVRAGIVCERLVRLVYAKGDRDAAENLLRDMIDDPESDDEHLFATDFYARKFGGRRTGLCTELLRTDITAGRRATSTSPR